MNYSHDVIVIGAGAAGLTAAGGCALFGLRVALIEADKMGGECLNTGCVPSKALIAAAKRAATARGPAHGVHLSAPSIDWAGVQAHISDAITAIEPHDSPDRFRNMGCEVIHGRARFNGPYAIEVDGRTLTAPRIVIATGSEPMIPDIEGIGSVPVLTNENLFHLTEQPEHLLILGGGAVGLEMGQSFRRLGSQVTIVDPGELMGRDDRDSVAVLRAVMEGEGVRFMQAEVTKVAGAPGSVTLTTTAGETIAGTHLLVATGRRARVSGFGLAEIGVRLCDDGIEVDARRRTSLKHIYAIGDCRAGPRLTHVAGYEGSNVVMEIALGIPAKVDWRALPWSTYTDPEIAQIGLTETAAREKYGNSLRVVREDFSHNDRAIAGGDAKGHLKVMFKGSKIVGASICGAHAGEMMLPFTQMITGKASSFALGSAIVAYPTRSEITKAAAFSAWEPLVFGAWSKRWAALVQKWRRAF